mmetsp:Transcript_1746/g.3090  ORF Transcript_1746/g.3090 Transcript_1746/m.3090 type:complete len:115 (+) Transcript_1746:2664-3008(+)
MVVVVVVLPAAVACTKTAKGNTAIVRHHHVILDNEYGDDDDDDCDDGDKEGIVLLNVVGGKIQSRKLHRYSTTTSLEGMQATGNDCFVSDVVATTVQCSTRTTPCCYTLLVVLF